MIRTLTVALALILVAPASAVEKLLGAPAAQAPASVPPDEVTAWLQPLAGRAAIACGTHEFAKTASAALTCAAEAIAQSKPFWIVFEDTSLDYHGWTGVVRNAEGKAWSIRFDGGSTMANMRRPHSVTVLTCDSLAVEGAQVRCGYP